VVIDGISYEAIWQAARFVMPRMARGFAYICQIGMDAGGVP
jgi:hypothetical protein